MNEYRQTVNMICSSVSNELVDHSDVVGASPVGAAPTTPSKNEMSILIQFSPSAHLVHI